MSQFNNLGTYFAHITENNRIKIWNTLTNTLEQEHSPDINTPFNYSCLTFNTENGSKDPDNIIIGTSEGNLMRYSIKKGTVISTIQQENKLSIDCVCCVKNIAYCGAQEYILMFDLKHNKLINKWKSGNEVISSILYLEKSNQLLTAGNVIKLWDVLSKKILKTFVGHNSEVSCLNVINATKSLLVSGSKTDRVLNIYNFKDEGKHINFIGNILMDDTVQFLSYKLFNNVIKIAATGAGGAVHVYEINTEEDFTKPLKPKTIVQVASNNNESIVIPLPILAAKFITEQTLKIGYGNVFSLTFEDVVLTNEKIQCLIRKPAKYSNEHKNKQPKLNGTEIHYVTPIKDIKPAKRKLNNVSEVLLETRLENLGLKEQINSKDTAHLLIQALNSKDKHLLRASLFTDNETIIKNTVNRLTFPLVLRLLQELSILLQGKTESAQTGVLWLRYVLARHSVSLMAHPDVANIFLDIQRSIENRVTLLTPLSKLKGKIDILTSQICAQPEDEEDACIVFKDKDPSDNFLDSEDEEKAIDYSTSDGSEMEFQDDELESKSEDGDSEND